MEQFLLPPLSEILQTLWADRDVFASASWFTFKEALGGFALGSAAAILTALVLARWRGVGRAIMPYAITIFESGFRMPNQLFVIGAKAMIGIAFAAIA